VASGVLQADGGGGKGRGDNIVLRHIALCALHRGGGGEGWRAGSVLLHVALIGCGGGCEGGGAAGQRVGCGHLSAPHHPCALARQDRPAMQHHPLPAALTATGFACLYSQFCGDGIDIVWMGVLCDKEGFAMPGGPGLAIPSGYMDTPL